MIKMKIYLTLNVDYYTLGHINGIFSVNHKQPPYMYTIWLLVSVCIDTCLNYQLNNMHTQAV